MGRRDSSDPSTRRTPRRWGLESNATLRDRSSSSRFPFLAKELFEPVEPLGPVSAELRRVADHLTQRCGIELERVLAAMTRAPHEARAFEDLDVLRHGV